MYCNAWYLNLLAYSSREITVKATLDSSSKQQSEKNETNVVFELAFVWQTDFIKSAKIANKDDANPTGQWQCDEFIA